MMKQYPLRGAEMLERVPGLGNVAQIVLCEHEHWDGSGYPQGRAGEDIPLASRIILACDAFDAMTSDRPWRGALKPWAAVRELRAGAGREFDPQVVVQLIGVLRESRTTTALATLLPARGRQQLATTLRGRLKHRPFWAVRPFPCLMRCGVDGLCLGTPPRGGGFAMAKDTEKLIRQLSLISFLMAERRPVSALEIKQDVEGYSEMNDDAFARRFYADRAELEALGIDLKVEKPPEGYFEAELYTLPPENFYLPPIKFSDGELAALQTSLSLLDGRFAYAEPLRLALQQLSWGKAQPARLG